MIGSDQESSLASAHWLPSLLHVAHNDDYTVPGSSGKVVESRSEYTRASIPLFRELVIAYNERVHQLKANGAEHCHITVDDGEPI